MKRKVLFLFLCAVGTAFGQFNESAPWMAELRKKSNPTARSQDQLYSFDEINEAFLRYWEGKDIRARGSGFNPFMRWQNYWQYQVNERGYLPSSSEIWNAYQNKASSAEATNPTANWTSIGPFAPGIYSGQLPGTGRINAVAVDPNDPNRWYAGAPAGGIWRSDDAGSTWTNLFDNFLQIGVSGIAIDPNDSNTIYIATGDDDAADSYSIGVFKTTDGGATWTPTGLGPAETTVSALMNEITIDPTNSNILWLGTNTGLFKSIDEGASWDLKLNGNITDFKLKPGTSETVYAVSNSAYYKSTNGEDFSEITDILPTSSGRRVLGVSSADPEVVYILTANIGSQGFGYQGFYKSTDGGETFTESPNTTNLMESNQAWFDLALEVSPTNANEVFMGCLNVWKSLNGGDSWIRLNQWFSNNPSYTHADIHTLKFFDDKLFCGSDGGLYVSENNGISFTDHTAGMAIGQIYRLSVSKQNAARMINGLQDNGGQVLDGGQWNNYHGGDGMDNAIDPTNPDILYGLVQFGSLLNISTNSGQSVGLVQSPSGGSVLGNWITPLAISSTGELFVGYDAVYKLNGNSWEQLSETIGVNSIEDLEVDPNDPQVIYAAESNGVYRSSDGGNTFTAFFFADPSSIISDMAINGTDGSAVYITTSNRVGISQYEQLQNPRGVFKIPVNPDGSAGLESDLTLNLPADQAYFSIVHQARHSDNPIYVGTNLGIYRLDDGLSEWEEYFTNFPSVAVSDLEVNLDDELIIASTYGRGVWQSPIPIQVPDNDLRMVVLSPPNDAVSCGSVIPEILVENNGLNTITNVDISYNIDGGPDQQFSEAVNLTSGETTLIPLPQLDLTPPAIASLQVTASIANDAYSDNNTLTQKIFFSDSGTADTINTFETTGEELLAFNEVGSGSLWERGEPTGTILNQVSSGTQAYATNLSGNHTNATIAVLLTDCYDFTTILAPVLRFNMAYDLEINFDIVYVQYSIDNGTTWQVLGSVNSQPNWYNSDRTNASSGSDDDCQ
ncbi:MAG: hypothetical protein OER83_03790, partial [Flavobacteriaceae bacterium]|nr:hypothetical protein [Flavobacteriaceae bacterium]